MTKQAQKRIEIRATNISCVCTGSKPMKILSILLCVFLLRINYGQIKEKKRKEKEASCGGILC
jgi:hypothetical protein